MTKTLINIPELAFVIVIDKDAKLTFARNHFPADVVFEFGSDTLAVIVEERLRMGQFTVVSLPFDQLPQMNDIIVLARKCNIGREAIVVDFPSHHDPKTLLRTKYGITQVHIVDALQVTEIQKIKLPFDKKDETGPFDIIGDIHGCFDELQALLKKLDYKIDLKNDRYNIGHLQKRKLVFVGDIVDRGPKIVESLQFVIDVCEQGMAYCVIGNHEHRLYRKLNGHNIALTHGLAESMQQLEKQSPLFIDRIKHFISQLPSHYVFDNAKLAVAHAGIKQKYLDRTSKRIQSFCMYGDTTGEMDEFGLPVRLNWAEKYEGETKVVYGHTPIEEPGWLNNTINIDTGCVFGGKLTALRYPEESIMQVNAKNLSTT